MPTPMITWHPLLSPVYQQWTFTQHTEAIDLGAPTTVDKSAEIYCFRAILAV